MIETVAITEWGLTHPWSTPEQIEQDLLLSRAICAIAMDGYLGKELVFRGGTALHKLYLPEPYRYSEDLDYVRRSSGGISKVTKALTLIGNDLGFTVKTRITEYPKVIWCTVSDSGLPLKIKIEVNTHERSPALPITRKKFGVESRWWSGTANVQMFHAAELMATKIRALYQRSKGRDLFDIWLALTTLQIAPTDILSAFNAYRPEKMTSELAIANLQAKLSDSRFRNDLDLLVPKYPDGYNVDSAAAIVIDLLLGRIDEAWRHA